MITHHLVGRFFFQLFYFLAVLNLVHENLRRLEAWNKMLIYDQCCISGNISGYFLFSLFVDETTETPDINVIAIRHGTLNNTEKRFNRRCYVRLIYAGFFCDFINNVCFGHGFIFLVRIVIEFMGGQI